MRNTTMMEECLPGSSKIDVICGLGAYGAGHVAAQQIGAPMWGRNKVWCCEGYDPAGTITYCELVGFGGIVVNREGDRFVDEGNHWNNARTRALIDQGINPDTGTYFNYCVIDQAMFDQAMEIGAPLGLTEAHLSLLVEGQTVDELAEKLGAPNLPATVERYNSDLESGGWRHGVRPHMVQRPGHGRAHSANRAALLRLAQPPRLHAGACCWLPYQCRHAVPRQLRQSPGRESPLRSGRAVCRSITGNEYVVGSAISFGTTMGLLTGEHVAALDCWEVARTPAEHALLQIAS